jgi:hypothetical protein
MRFAKKTVCLAIVAGTRFVQLFLRRGVNAIGGILDLADNRFQFFYCGIGIVLELPEST